MRREDGWLHKCRSCDRISGLPTLSCSLRSSSVSQVRQRPASPAASRPRHPVIELARDSNDEAVHCILHGPLGQGHLVPPCNFVRCPPPHRHPPQDNPPQSVFILFVVRNKGADIDAKVQAGLGVHAGDTALHIAARKHHQKVIANLLEKNADATILNAKNETPLACALQGNVESETAVRTCTALLNAGCELPEEGPQGVSAEALNVAAAHSKPELLRLFLQVKNVDPDLQDHCGRRPIVSAALGGNLECARMLVAREVDVNARGGNGHSDGPGCTALAAASLLGHIEICKLLLSKKADANVFDERLTTPLMHVCRKKDNTELVDIMLPHCQIDLPSPLTGKAALHYACSSGCLDIVKKLVDAGADLELCDRSFYKVSPLLAAVGCGHFDVTEYLLSKGVKRIDDAIEIAEQAKDIRIAALLRGEEVPLLPAEPSAEEQQEHADRVARELQEAMAKHEASLSTEVTLEN